MEVQTAVANYYASIISIYDADENGELSDEEKATLRDDRKAEAIATYDTDAEAAVKEEALEGTRLAGGRGNRGKGKGHRGLKNTRSDDSNKTEETTEIADTTTNTDGSTDTQARGEGNRRGRCGNGGGNRGDGRRH